MQGHGGRVAGEGYHREVVETSEDHIRPRCYFDMHIIVYLHWFGMWLIPIVYNFTGFDSVLESFLFVEGDCHWLSAVSSHSFPEPH